ncbi:hypothetical protein ACFS5L_27175 [Streptomyces phyllanthi]|uniref:hypothetical protein n=1 Tax=Streptomyces phyllanthi TaxID=1803180 RepID=UPI0036299877
MPTPHGSRGAMAFGAEELRVLRRALALALNPSSATAEDVQDCLRLAESVDEAAREGARLRAFLLADLARYRAALPGTVMGYLALLDDALGAGHRPTADDLAALRALRGNPQAAALLDRCDPPPAAPAAPAVPASRTRLTALPGGRSACASEGADERPADQPERPERPVEKPGPGPAPRPGQPKAPDPGRRPIPTPGEVFPPKRKPGRPPADPPQQRLAAG